MYPSGFSIDQETEDLVHDILRSRFQEKTILCVKHKLRNIMDFDKVVMMDTGRVVEFDFPRNLLEKGGSAFKALYESAGHLRSK